MTAKKIGVMCGSSNACPQKYLDMAFKIGEKIALNGDDVIYGGGAKGLMRKVADGALSKSGIVHGYIPTFMIEVEWQHKSITHLHITKDMSERKHLMMTGSDATIFLPGGCGTMEEFFEWLSAKRLGLYLHPLIIVNFDHYYDPLIELLQKMENEKFHNPEHSKMYSVCENVDDLYDVLENAPLWSSDAISFASAKTNNATKEN